MSRPRSGPVRLPALSPTPARILVKEVNWLGDLVMTMPALRALRRAFPHAALTVLVKRELASFFDGTRWVDEVMGYRVRRSLAGLVDRRRVVADIRRNRFDLAILFPRSFEAALWARMAGVPQRVGYIADRRGPLLTRTAVRDALLLQQHQVHDYLYLLRATLGIVGDPAECGIDVEPRHRASMDAWLAAHRRRRGPLLALAPAAAYGPAKEWPAERWTALADRLAERHGAECVLVGAPAERARCAQIAAATRQGALVAAGETNIGQMIALLARCNGFAGNDSGAAHAAGAVGIPTVALFGSTNPQRTAPLGPRTRVLYHRLDCSPCMARTCRFGHYDCLKRIDATEVESALLELGALPPRG
ncbi:MAG TPA: lipopolysaccharide heptosyltransferase II [Candidatus Dormibacteraeota bacterium]|nr:lipopolysaccharide heptosyltransferase II [Candidatus Dormibacteraeota bacterium]